MKLSQLTALVMLTLTVTASAQDLPSTQFKDGAAIREAFSEVVQDARTYTVQITSGPKQLALGTIVDANGLILTKASSVKASRLTVTLSEGKSFPAEVVAEHAQLDLALLRIEATQLPIVQWNTQFDHDLGRWLITPGIENTPVGVGVIAEKPRQVMLTIEANNRQKNIGRISVLQHDTILSAEDCGGVVLADEIIPVVEVLKSQVPQRPIRSERKFQKSPGSDRLRIAP